MDQFQFIQRENNHRYQELLGRVTDENQRQLLLKLLSEEKTKRSKTTLPKRDTANETASATRACDPKAANGPAQAAGPEAPHSRKLRTRADQT